MREIRFRAKTIKGGQWIEGDLFRAGTEPSDGEFAISYWDDEDGWMNENVRPDTIGEYIGLKDKNGTDIFEGDNGRSALPLATEGTQEGGGYKAGVLRRAKRQSRAEIKQAA